VLGATESIAAVAEEQSAETEKVSASAEVMGAQVEEMGEQAQRPAATVDQLRTLVGQFKVEAETDAGNVVPVRRAA
jgi:methyl-accepting chemotaxis protein